VSNGAGAALRFTGAVVGVLALGVTSLELQLVKITTSQNNYRRDNRTGVQNFSLLLNYFLVSTTFSCQT
jgi:hypothetical protein